MVKEHPSHSKRRKGKGRKHMWARETGEYQKSSVVLFLFFFFFALLGSGLTHCGWLLQNTSEGSELKSVWMHSWENNKNPLKIIYILCKILGSWST